jgi:hypothetical protein
MTTKKKVGPVTMRISWVLHAHRVWEHGDMMDRDLDTFIRLLYVKKPNQSQRFALAKRKREIHELTPEDWKEAVEDDPDLRS